MKKTNIIAVSAASLVALIAVSGIAFSTFAAEDTTTDTNTNRPGRPGFGADLTDEERAEFEAMREERQAEREAVREAAQAAIEANSYNAWVEAVGDDCPMLENINEGNWARFVEMHNLREEAREIAEELGIERGPKGGAGMHGGRGGLMR